MSNRTISDVQFLVGRDLAVTMMREGEGLKEGAEGGGNISIGAEGRTGPQNRWAQKYFERLVADRSLIDGFAAVMSDLLGNPWEGAEFFAAFDLNEMLGPPGAIRPTKRKPT